MTAKISYPGLKCIIEFLEVSPRFRMTCRSSDLQKIDNRIPLRVNSLKIWKNKVSLDDMSYCTDQSGLNEQKRMKVDKSKEKLLRKYFEGRTNIHVNHVVFHETPVYRRILVTLQLNVNKLEIPSSSFVDYLDNIDTNCLPLKNLILSLYEPFDVNHPVIDSAQNVILRLIGHQDKLNGVEKLQREKLHIENTGFEQVDVVGIIRNWMENGKKIGTKYLLSGDIVCIYNTFLGIEREFGDFTKTLEEVNEPILDSLPQFSIPMSSTANILVYGTEKLVPRIVYRLVLRVVAVEE
ncbi:hypothetical protein CRE_19940 [Caenorhabditis remanei]|uniref:F-box associated domain-containing protein n=1 Tax=Caenorhabditis remanei TaxID=31234 RepID=E3N8E3_CAERE|nr:hypothetical protein CRE_19940 [Caenorhabditis remanei]